MPHIRWVARQNKLEIPRDKTEVNNRETRESDGRAHDPDTMVAPLTPNPTRKAEALTRVPTTITSRRKEDAICIYLYLVVYYESIPQRESIFFFLFFFFGKNIKDITEEIDISGNGWSCQ